MKAFQRIRPQHRVLGVLVVVAASGTPSMLLSQTAGIAQVGGSPTRVAATVALVTDLPNGADGEAVILRRSGDNPDVILLKRSAATPPRLSAAVMTLLMLREIDGDTATKSMMFRVPMNRGPAAWTYSEELRAAQVLRDFSRMESRPLAGVGTVQYIQVYLLKGVFYGQFRGQSKRMP